MGSQLNKRTAAVIEDVGRLIVIMRESRKNVLYVFKKTLSKTSKVNRVIFTTKMQILFVETSR